MIRQYGWAERYISQVKGINTRLDELQAAILSVKLPHLEAWNLRRRQLARQYSSLLADAGVLLPFEPEEAGHVFHQYVIRHPRRDELRAYLSARQIHTLIHYPLPIHLQPAYRGLGYAPGSLPVTEMVQSGSMRTTECFMCETCVDACPQKAIAVGFGRDS